MAFVTKTHLKDELSEKFLIENGFVLVDAISPISKWMGAGVCLKLDSDCIIKTRCDLHETIVTQSFKRGVQRGKQDALTKISQHLSNLIFDIDHNALKKIPTY